MSAVPQRLGKYELRQSLGRGNIGEVWHGYDHQLRRDVAIKVIHTDLQSDPNFMTRFTQEGQKLTSLQHSNIVQVRDSAIHRQAQSPTTTAYIVSDLIQGKTLGEYMAASQTKQQGTIAFSYSDLVYLFTSLGLAIDYAHQQGIIHGDIKPSNILLDTLHDAHFAAGEPMLTDFGLAMLLGEEAGVGSPYYMSPEQAKGDSANNRSDIYSLGVILYELCTGVKPFRDESSVAVMMQHINTLPTPPILINPRLPAALSEVILRALAKDTPTRFPIASLLATAIADACSIRSTIPIPRISLAEEESAYHTASRQYSSLLGVSQPTGSTPPVTRGNSQAMPPVNPRISSSSQPMPTVAQRTNTSDLLTGSGQQRIIQPTSVTPNAPTTGKTSTVASSSTGSTSARIAVPPQRQEPLVTPPQSSFPVSAPLPPHTPFPMMRRGQRSRRSDFSMYTIIAALAILLIIVAGVISNLLFNTNQQSASVIGHVFFQDDAFGHADMLRIVLQGISAPPQGKSYQAWLQENTQHILPLGSFILSNNTAMLLYSGDKQHTNLLSTIEGMSVTVEDTGSHHTKPTGKVVYRADINTVTLQYIRNILYETPNFPDERGVIVGLFETIKSMNDKAGSIVDSIQGTHDYGLAKRQAIRVIELTDGTQYSMASGDLPPQTRSNVDAKVGLISSPTQPGYIDTLAAQLDTLQHATSNNPPLLQHIQNIRNAITDLRQWTQEIRQYDVQLVKASNIADPHLAAVALQLKQVVMDAYTGRTIPPDEGPKPTLGSAGAYQAYIECQYLTTLDVKQVP